jgi:uncharacterized protein YjbI with pentapeptide repeats
MADKRPRDSTSCTGTGAAAGGLAEEGEKRAKTGHVVLNVGGVRFETTVNTLCSFSDSFFAKMFGGGYDTRTEPDGSYFIDRSGEHFGQVLNFMRTHRLALPLTQAGIVALQEEMEYYQLAGPFRDACLATTDYTRREMLDMRARGHTVFSGANLSGLNLGYIDLSKCIMQGCKLQGTDLSSANIYECNLSAANLSAANLSAANLLAANLSEANLDGANLSECVFTRSTRMYSASLRGADLSRVEFQPGSDLRNVDITDAIFDGALGSVFIDRSTQGIDELECINQVPEEVLEESELTKLGTIKLKDLWPEAEGMIDTANESFVIEFNVNPEGMERPVVDGLYAREEFSRRPPSNAAHMIRLSTRR